MPAPQLGRIEAPLHHHAQSPENSEPDEDSPAQSCGLDECASTGQQQEREQAQRENEEDAVDLKDLSIHEREPRHLFAPVKSRGNEQVHHDERGHHHASGLQMSDERLFSQRHTDLLSTKTRMNGVIENSRSM